MIKRSLSTKGYRAKDFSELVHTDVCGPTSVQAQGGYKQFTMLTIDYARYDYVYLMRQKFEAFERFKEFWVEAEKQLDIHIKFFWSD